LHFDASGRLNKEKGAETSTAELDNEIQANAKVQGQASWTRRMTHVTASQIPHKE